MQTVTGPRIGHDRAGRATALRIKLVLVSWAAICAGNEQIDANFCLGSINEIQRTDFCRQDKCIQTAAGLIWIKGCWRGPAARIGGTREEVS